MKKYAFHTDEIPTTRPSKEEQRRKLAIYNLKSELGLLIPFDESNNNIEGLRGNNMGK